MNIALFSINKDAYSETFIAAHKTLLEGTIFYYYGSNCDNMQFENSKSGFINYSFYQKVLRKISKKYKQRVNKASLLRDSLIKNNIDVILVEYGTLAHNLLPLFRMVNTPFVVHFHGYDASIKSIIEKCNNYKEVFSKCSAVIAVSSVMERGLLDIGCPRKKLYLNPCGPNDLFLEIQPNSDEKLLIGVGRFVDKKAPYFTILAFSKVVKRCPEAKLILAGDGILLNTCKNLVDYLGISHAVSFPGNITPDVFRELLTKCRAFVQHSITAMSGDMEGTPVVILEAQAASVPVISTFHAGIQDVVLNEETGMLVNEKDVDGMADAMIMLLSNRNLAREMGVKARKHIKENYTMSKHINTLNDIIKEVSFNH